MTSKKRTRRTPEQMIADLQAEIERVKAREAARHAKKDPALRHISAAIRSIDKAAEATGDAATRQALNEVRPTLAACLSLNGAVPAVNGAPRLRKARKPAPEPRDVLAYIKKHPGATSSEMCKKLDTDAATLRPVLHGLRDEKKVKATGKARATRYSAV